MSSIHGWAVTKAKYKFQVISQLENIQLDILLRSQISYMCVEGLYQWFFTWVRPNPRGSLSQSQGFGQEF